MHALTVSSQHLCLGVCIAVHVSPVLVYCRDICNLQVYDVIVLCVASWMLSPMQKRQLLVNSSGTHSSSIGVNPETLTPMYLFRSLHTFYEQHACLVSDVPLSIRYYYVHFVYIVCA